MATLSDILSRRFTGDQWTLRGDDYSTLEWDSGNPDPKPAEADLRGLSDSVDADLAADKTRRDQMVAIEDKPDAFLTVFEILAAAIDDMQGKLRAAALTSPLAPAAVTAIGALRAKLAQARTV